LLLEPQSDPDLVSCPACGSQGELKVWSSEGSRIDVCSLCHGNRWVNKKTAQYFEEGRQRRIERLLGPTGVSEEKEDE